MGDKGRSTNILLINKLWLTWAKLKLSYIVGWCCVKDGFEVDVEVGLQLLVGVSGWVGG